MSKHDKHTRAIGQLAEMYRLDRPEGDGDAAALLYAFDHMKCVESGVLLVERRHYALVAARARCWTMQQSLAKTERDGDLRPPMKSRYYELVDHLRQLEAATVKP